MAQADYVTIPTRISIPGVGVKPSTSPARVGPAEVIANLPRYRQLPMLTVWRPRRWTCVTAVFNDTGAILGDLAADAIGAIHQASDSKAGSVA